MARASTKRRDEAEPSELGRARDVSGVHRRSSRPSGEAASAAAGARAKRRAASGARAGGGERARTKSGERARAGGGERAGVGAKPNAKGATKPNARSRTSEAPRAERTVERSGIFARLTGRSSAPPALDDGPTNRRLVKKPTSKSATSAERDADAAPRVSLRVRMIEARASAAHLWHRVRRPIVFVARLLLVAALLVAAAAVGRLVERHVRTSPAFATKEIGVEGIERLTREEVVASAGLALGSNVFDVAPEDAALHLRSHPWIADAQVTRRLPGAFDIVVREHHAVAVLSIMAIDDSPTRLYLVAEDGTVFKELETGDPVDLPMITGLDEARFAADPAFRASVVLEVVALLHDYRGAGLFRREPISEIHVEPDDGLSLFVGEDAMYVRLGRGPYRQKLSRLRRVLDRLRREEARALYVYLDNVRRPDRVTVRLRE